MITEEKKIEKVCSFYASDYHLEMIMVPYISKKLEEDAQITIITEKSLKDTVKDVISNVSLSKERKQKILSLDWANSSLKSICSSNKAEEQVIFVIGSMDYIEEKNEAIEKKEPLTRTKVINCYSIEDAQKNAREIAIKHTKILNTREEKELGKKTC